MTNRLETAEFVLAVLSTSSEPWTPVQVQKLFFLLDQRLGLVLGGAYFQFQAYDYGPFDSGVYNTIELLAYWGQAVVNRPPVGMRTYSLTDDGLSLGRARLAALPPEIRNYIETLSAWVRKLTFSELVSAIYKEFPAMKANSIFRGQ